jgi:hypothetical protein
MKDKYTRANTPITREGDQNKRWYRTLFQSYLYRPPAWVYVVELIVAVVAIYVLLEHDGELVRVLLPLLLEQGS